MVEQDDDSGETAIGGSGFASVFEVIEAKSIDEHDSQTSSSTFFEQTDLFSSL